MENISITKLNSNFFELNEKLVIKLDNIKFPFGFENNNTILKCNITTKQTELIKNIENMLEKKIKDIDHKYEIKSQLILKEKYANQLITKVHSHKNKILSIFVNNDDIISPYTIITNKNKYEMIIFLDKLWLNNDIFFYKWKIRKINEL